MSRDASANWERESSGITSSTAACLSAVARGIFGKAPAPPPRLVVGESGGLPGWLLLGERPNREIAFGAVGKFWRPVIEWRDVAHPDFAGFAEPGWGKIAANLSVAPHGRGATVLSYECRTVTTDLGSRRQFLRYWWLIRPFVAHILRATLRKIKADAESARQAP